MASVCQSVSQNWCTAVYNLLIINSINLPINITTISKKVYVRLTQVIQLIWRDLHLWGQKCKANGAYDTVNLLPITLPNVHQFKKKSFTSRLSDKWVVK